MKFAKFKQLSSLGLCIVLIIGCFSACKGKTTSSEPVKEEKAVTIDWKVEDTDFDLAVKASNRYSVIKQGEWELLVNGMTTEVTVYNTRTGTAWTTNPAERSQDSIAAGEPVELLNAQLVITACDRSERTSWVKNNYSEAINYGQFAFYPIENGIGVNYVIGKQSKTYLYPLAIKAEKMDDLLSRMDEETAALISINYTYLDYDALDEATRTLVMNDYPTLKDGPLYVIGGMSVGSVTIGDILAAEMERAFVGAGYTAEAWEQDVLENKLDVADKKNRCIRLSLEYTLSDGALCVCIPRESILYDKNAIALLDVSVLPNLGATKVGSDGYLFVPDGSGALIYPTANKTNVPVYTKPVYGEDITLNSNKQETVSSETIRFPVYGFYNGSASCAVVIEEGDAVASICAEPGNVTSEYYKIYPTFSLLQKQQETESVMNLSGQLLYQAEPLNSDIELCCLFTEESNGYTDMAREYQAYLSERVKTVEANYSLYIEMVGAAEYATTRFGIPVKAFKSLATYKQTETILGELLDSGVKNIQLGYSDWANNGANNSLYDRLTPLKTLGNDEEWNGLLAFLKKNNIPFYPLAEFQYVSHDRKFDGFSVNRDTAKTLKKNVALRANYDLATLNSATLAKTWIVSPSRYEVLATGYLEDSTKLGLSGTDVGSFGETLYSDFAEKAMFDRQESSRAIVKTMEKFKNANMAISVTAGNAYALPYASVIKEMPMASGGHYLLDQDVPFYAIALHGLIPYTTPALNLSASYELDVLRAAECGALPYYRLIAEDNSALKDTDMNLYSVSYIDWRADIQNDYARLSAVLGDCANSGIVSHQKEGELVTVRYENGQIVYVNYGDEAVTVDGLVVAARDFAAYKEAGV